jgi:hypothetical protein
MTEDAYIQAVAAAVADPGTYEFDLATAITLQCIAGALCVGTVRAVGGIHHPVAYELCTDRVRATARLSAAALSEYPEICAAMNEHLGLVQNDLLLGELAVLCEDAMLVFARREGIVL